MTPWNQLRIGNTSKTLLDDKGIELNRWGRRGFIWLAAALGLLLASLICAPAARADGDNAPASQPTTLPIQIRRITLHVKNAPLMDVIRSIEWQTGVWLVNDPTFRMQEHRVTLEVDNALFWNVAFDITKQIGGCRFMQFTNGNDPGGYRLLPARGSGIPATQSESIFNLAPINATITRVENYANGPSEGNITLNLQVFSDPAIDLARVRFTAVITKAIDMDGRELLINPKEGERGQIMEARFNGFGSQLSCQLKDSAASPRKIALLQGEAHFKSESPVNRLCILDPRADTEVTQDGTTVEILDIAHEKETWRIRLRVTQAPDAVRWNPGIKPAAAYSPIERTVSASPPPRVVRPTAAYSLIDENGETARFTSVSPEEGATFLITLIHQQLPQLGQMNKVNGANGIGGGGHGHAAAPKAEKDAAPDHVLLIINLPAPPVDFTVPFELTNLPLP